MRNIKSNDLSNMIYYQVPKWLMDLFIDKKISQGAFKTYILMYDRLKLSAGNKWVDKNGDVYIKYSYNEMTEDLNCSRQAVSNNLQDLEKLDLIDKKKNFSSSSTFYLKIYSEENDSSQEKFTSQEDFTSEENLDCHESTKLDYSSLENLDANKNNFNNNKYNKNNNREKFQNSENKNSHTEDDDIFHTDEVMYSVSVVKRIRQINKNQVEGDQILRVFLEKKLSEELVLWILDFLEMRSKGGKIYIQEVRSVVNQLINKYSNDEIRIKALENAIASRHNSIVYEKKKESKEEKSSDEKFRELFGDPKKIVNFWKDEVL